MSSFIIPLQKFSLVTCVLKLKWDTDERSGKLNRINCETTEQRSGLVSGIGELSGRQMILGHRQTSVNHRPPKITRGIVLTVTTETTTWQERGGEPAVESVRS